ncbi:MAG: transposase [Planctomycetes bacterium]|nr:transposase [Planctomycetota bacterium]
MARTLGYMLTWTTYGTWLQGDERGYVKNGAIHPANKCLKRANKQLQLQEAVYLSEEQREIVRKAIIEEARTRGQQVCALSVEANHVHIVLEYSPQPIGRIVALCKNAGRMGLKAGGITGRLWTCGYDKRFCFDWQRLGRRIKYVRGQNPT